METGKHWAGIVFSVPIVSRLFGIKVLEFTIADGKVKSLTVRVADFVEYTPYEFKKINP